MPSRKVGESGPEAQDLEAKERSGSSLYGLGEGEGDGEAAGDAVGEGDGEAVSVPVVEGPVEGAGVVVVAVLSGRAGGSYGPLSAADNAAAATTAASKHAGVSTTTSGRRTNGRTHPSKTYHNNAANTTTTATDTHHGNPRTSRPLPSYTLPPSYTAARTARSDSEARGTGQPRTLCVGPGAMRTSENPYLLST
jgi:hypothetical protein